jgi:EPS-associated MarR family transcriptional regulator
MSTPPPQQKKKTRNLIMKPQEARALQMLRALDAKPDVTQRELAQRIDLSLSRTNYVLRALVRKGLVKVENFRQSPHKAGYWYVLTPDGVVEKARLTKQFLVRKYAEYDAIQEEIAELEAELSGKGL